MTRMITFNSPWKAAFLCLVLALRDVPSGFEGTQCLSNSWQELNKLRKDSCQQRFQGFRENHRTINCISFESQSCHSFCRQIAPCLNGKKEWYCFSQWFYMFWLTRFNISAVQEVSDGSCVTNMYIKYCGKWLNWSRYKYCIKTKRCERKANDGIHECEAAEVTNSTNNPAGEPQIVRADYDLNIEMMNALIELDIQKNNSLQEAVAIFEDKINDYINRTAVTGQASNTSVTLREKMENVLSATVTFEQFVLQFAEYHLSESLPVVSLTSEKVDLQVRQGINENDTDFHLEDAKRMNYIKIPSKDFHNGSVLLGVLYKDLHKHFATNSTEYHTANTSSKNLNTIIMSATMTSQSARLQENVTLVFRNVQAATRNRECVFWNFLESGPAGWSGQGCHVTNMDDSKTECSCNHLTHFAVLVQFDTNTAGTKNSIITAADEKILIILTRVGLALSLIGITLTIICYIFLADIKAPLSQIRVSLVSSLGAGQVIFFAGVGATENKGACVAVAAMVQYFLMAAFCWMLVEGIYLYLFVVQVYNVSNKVKICHGVSWGFPAVMVILTLSIAAGKDGVESFVSEEYCWMSASSGLIWVFISFLVFIELLNVAILVRVIKEMTSMEQVKDNQAEQIRLGIRGCVVLIPLLGVTWLFGLLSSTHKAFVYIFIIFNATQGLFIFLLHCVRNSEIRERLKRRIRVILPAASIKRSSRVDETSGDLSLRKIKVTPMAATSTFPKPVKS